MRPNRRRLLLAATATSLGAIAPAHGQGGSPASPSPPASLRDEIWHDTTRQRDIPVRIRWPAQDTPAPSDGRPVVLFSHGLGGTIAGGERWGEAWCAAGMVVLHLQHPGSDLEAVRRVARDFRDQSGLRQATGPAQLLARLGDVVFALDELARRKLAGTDRWVEIRPQAVGMSGHSFGAHTTLGMAGQRYPGHPGILEPRLAAFIALSPTLPAQGDPVQAFERLIRPVLSITGTRDGDVVGVGATPERRIGVFAALPPGRRAQLVLEDADHMSFSGQTGRAVEIVARDAQSRALQPRHHALVAQITSDWWRAHLAGDAQAMARLASPMGLTPGDRWQMD